MSQWWNPLFQDFLSAVYARYRKWLNRSRARRAADWVQIDATIRSVKTFLVGKTNTIGTGRVFEWLPIVQYEYQVGNATYSGKANGEIWCYDDQGVFESTESLIGATLPVRYHPSRPSRSVYLPQDGGPPQFLPASPDAATDLVVLSLKK